jgi:hypothetical protein
LTMCISCSTDLKFDLPERDPLLAIQSFIGPDRDSRVRVTMARGIQDTAIQMDIDCQVDLFENGVFYKSLTLDTPAILSGTISTQGYLDFPVDSSVVLSEGKEYTVKVNYPGFETVTAKDIKPHAVRISEINWRLFTGEMPEWYYDTPWTNTYYDIYVPKPRARDTLLIEFVITFDDPPGIDNFYCIGMNLVTPSGRPAPVNFHNIRCQYALYSDPDPPFQKYNYRTKYPYYYGWHNPITYEILWNDNDFDGSRHSITIIAPRPNVGAKCIISLYSLSENYHNYMIDRWKYYKVSDDPFSEPIRLHSNTSNGCGIFATYSVDKDTLQF